MTTTLNNTKLRSLTILLTLTTALQTLGQAAHNCGHDHAHAHAHGVPASREDLIAGLVRDAVVHRQAHADGSTCISLSNMSVMFEPGATESQMTAFLESMPDEQLAAFNLTSRWTQTATDGTVEQGEKITITYSFVPDGTEIPGFNGEPTSPSNLFATMDASFPGGRTVWKALFAQSFQHWGRLLNIEYVEVSDDGAPFGMFTPGQLGARGDVRIAMHPIGAGPLAYNFYPANGGDMVMDSDDIATFTDPTNNYVDFRNTIMHEHGHGLGLAHTIPVNNTKLMEPFLNSNFDGPQENDIRAAQHQYGDRLEPSDEYGQELFVGGPLRDPSTSGEIKLEVKNVAIERADSSDWYGFSAFAQVPIAIRVQPVGTTYQSGPQNGTAETVNALAARDLGFRLWRRVSAQTGQLQMVAQIDFNEASQAEYHPPIAYTAAGYMLVEVYSTDNVDDVQRYELTISNLEIEAAQSGPALVVANGVQILSDGDFLIFDDTAVGQTSGVALLVQNAGDGPLVFTDSPPVRFQGPAAGDFSAGFLPAEIAPGGQAILGLSFNPTAEGQRVAVLSLRSNDPNASDFAFIVRGTALPGQEPVMEVTEAAAGGEIDLDELQVNDTTQLSLEVENTGSANLTIIGTSRIEGAAAGDMTIADGIPVTIPPGQSSDIQIEVTPTVAGQTSGLLRLFNNSAVNPYEITISYTAVEPLDDCNGNGVDDAEDIATGFSEDCDANGLPDECQTDTDGDSVIDACDVCPGADDLLDSDQDGTPDCQDECPLNAEKTEAGVCGCDLPDIDSDGDGVLDCEDPNDGGVDPNESGDFDPNQPGDFDPNQPDDVDPNESGDFDPNQVDDFDPNQVDDFDPNDVDPNEADEFDDDDDLVEFDQDGNFVPGPGLCGFGAVPAALMSLMSMGYGKVQVRRKRNSTTRR